MQNAGQRIKDLKEISIAIDTLDDIFSDFDPRPIEMRALSEDFINELKKRYRETRTGEFAVTIYAPLTLKDDKSEKTVVQRLKKYFKHRSIARQRDLSVIRVRGIIYFILGVFFLSFLTLVTYYNYFSRLTIEILNIILMPLGWFGIWEGLSKLVDSSPVFRQEEIVFTKLSRATYQFKYIDESQPKKE